MKQLIFRLPNGNLFFKSNFEHDFVLNGKIIRCSEFTVDKIDSLCIRHYNMTCIHYSNNEGEILSYSDHKAKIEELLENAEYNETKGEYEFDDVEEQVAYIRFTRKWVPIHDKVYTYEDVQYEIVDIPSGSAKYPEIKVSWRYEPNITPICTVNVREFVREEIKRAAIKYDKYLDPKKTTGCDTLSNLRYTKLNDNYVSDFEQFDQNPIFRGYMAECENKLDKVADYVNNVFKREVNKKTVPSDYGRIIGEFRVIAAGLIKIEPMKKSIKNHSALISEINGYIEYYEKHCSNIEV